MTQQESVQFGRPEFAAPASAGPVGWRTAIPVLVVSLVALVWVHWDTASLMYETWARLHAYNHGFLILPVCLYLAWERRAALRAIEPRPNLFGVLLVAAFGALWLVADTVEVNAPRQAALIGMAEGILLATLGWRLFRALLFPMLYAWLMVPADFGLLPVLQTMATAASSWGIGLLGIPIFVEGFFIELSSGRYWVAPGCAGLNFLLSGFALSLLYGEQMYNGWRKRVLCVVVMVVVAIVANWFRIVALIVAGHYLNQVYDINDHYMEGWLFFAAIVFVMMWVGLRFRDPIRETPHAATGPQALAGSAAVAMYVAVAAASVATSAVYPVYASYQRGNLPPPAVVHVAFPDSIGGWRRTASQTDWRPVFEGADAQAVARYVKDGDSIDLFVAYYERQGPGRELAAYQNDVNGGDNWNLLRRGAARTRIGAVETEVAATRLKSGARERLVWHSYWVDGRFTRSPAQAKLLQAKADLLFGERRSGLIAVSAETAEREPAFDTFLRALTPPLSMIASGPAGG